jgi:hypothetical protein
VSYVVLDTDVASAILRGRLADRYSTGYSSRPHRLSQTVSLGIGTAVAVVGSDLRREVSVVDRG